MMALERSTPLKSSLVLSHFVQSTAGPGAALQAAAAGDAKAPINSITARNPISLCFMICLA